jgi:hypothetical protein
MNQERRTEGHAYRERYSHDHEEQRVVEGLPEERASEELEVIPCSDEAQIVERRESIDVEIGQAQREGHQHGQYEESADHRQRRRHEEPGAAL